MYKVGICHTTAIGVLFGCFGRQIDGPGLPGCSIIYQGHLFALKPTTTAFSCDIKSVAASASYIYQFNEQVLAQSRELNKTSSLGMSLGRTPQSLQVPTQVGDVNRPEGKRAGLQAFLWFPFDHLFLWCCKTGSLGYLHEVTGFDFPPTKPTKPQG